MNRLLPLQLLIAHSSFLIPQQGLGQTSLSHTVISSGSERYCAEDALWVSPLVPDSFIVRGDARVVMHSETGITLKPGFKAGGWDAGGFFRAGIAQRCFVYVWNGSVSSEWDRPHNWTPYGVPGLTDEAIVPATQRHPVYDVEEGVAKLTMDGGQLMLHRPLAVSDSLKLIKGVVYAADTAQLVLAQGTVAAWASDSAHVQGPVTKVGNDAFVFPLGRNGHFRPLSISSPADASHAFTAEYVDVNSAWTYGHADRDGTIADIARNEYWHFHRAAGTGHVEVTLTWDSLSHCTFDTLGHLLVTAYDGSQWKDLGNGGTAGDTISGTITSDGPATVYGAYAIGTTDTIYCDCLPSMADAGGDRDIHFGSSVTLGPAVTYPNLDYAWSPATYLDDDGIANPLCEPLAPVRYYLTVDDGICTVTDSALVRPMAEFCGSFPPHTALPPDTNFIMGGIIDPIVFDRFGNTYNISDITHGSCTPDWDTEDEVTAGFFSLSFCTENEFNPFTTQVKATIAQVFEDISGLIVPQACGTASATVNIQVIAPEWGMEGALGAASQFYIPEWELCTNVGQENSGIIYGQVWQAINTGVNQPNLMDAQIYLNFVDFTFNADHTQQTPSGEFDLYSVMLHEIIHCLGFGALMLENGQNPWFADGANFRSRFDTHLHGNGTPVLTWGLGNLYSPMLNTTTPLTGCNMRFIGAHCNADIASWAEGRFSHFSEACNPGTDRVMLPALTPATDHRALSDDDVNVLLDLGYEVTGTFPKNQGATPSGGPGIIGYRDGLGASVPACATRISMELCESPDDHVTIALADLIGNDINATGVAGLELVQGSGTLSVTGTDEWEYHPNGTGIHVLRYVPVDNPTAIDITTVGSSTCVTVEVWPCDPLGTCHKPDACNMICNPDFDYPFTTDECFNNAVFLGAFPWWPDLVPSWMASHGSPDWMDCQGVNPPNPGYVWVPSQCGTPPPNPCNAQSEGFMAAVTITNGNSYTLSYYRRLDVSLEYLSGTPMDNFFVRLFHSSSDLPFYNNILPPLPAQNQLVAHEVDVSLLDWEQVTVCFTADNDYDRIWFYPEATTNMLWTAMTIDRIVLVEDTYSAGTDRSIPCGNTALGEIACEADDVSYSWTVQGETNVLSTGQQLLVNANATTTYQVTRSYPANPATVAFPTTANNCTLVDDVTVTVTAPIILTTDFTDATCGNCDGTAEVTGITNGTSPFLYLWEDDGEESVSITDEAEDLCPGTYTLYVTDDEGCVATKEMVIDETGCEECEDPTANSSSFPKHPVMSIACDNIYDNCRHFGNDIAVGCDGNVYVAGIFSGHIDIGAGDMDATADIEHMVIKYSADGTADWIVHGGNEYAWFSRRIAVGMDGEVYFSASVLLDDDPLDKTSFIARLDPSDGSVMWQEDVTATYGEWLDVRGLAVSPLTGDLYAVASTEVGDIITLRYSSTGTLLDSDTYAASGEGNGIAVDNGGNVFITGREDIHIMIRKYDEELNVIWTKVLDYDGDIGYGNGIATDPDGNVYLTGGYIDDVYFGPGGTELKTSLSSSTDLFTASYDTDGDFRWVEVSSACDETDEGKGISVSNGQVAVTGEYRDDLTLCTTNLPNSGSSVNRAIFTVAYGLDGSCEWVENPSMGGSSWVRTDAIAHDAFGTAFITGYFYSTVTFNGSALTAPYGGTNMYVARISDAGAYYRLADEEEEDTPALLSADSGVRMYPNPTTGLLTIENRTDESMSLVIMDALGRTVTERTAAADATITVDLSAQPPGMYLVRLWGNSTFVVERIIRE